MAKIYYELIKKGLRTIDDVPLKWRADVQALLDSDTE
ncbi:CD1375 family protein [Bacillus methanolicus]|nr:CD1375 family protein [Bacillus methanolicus]